MEDKNKRKGIIYLVIAVVTLLVLVAGATYAYFQAQIGNSESFNIDATAGTTDLLTFTMADINTSTSNPNVTDSHNKVGDTENTEIVINATQQNFGEDDTSLGDGIKATAKLTANNTSKTATQYYNVFFVMDTNDLIYTQDTDHPELILTVIGPDTKEVKTITGLNYHNADPSNPNDVSGFDITGRTDAFAIKTNQEIKVESTTPDLTTTQDWQIKVTLVNLKNDQNKNTDKTITGNVVITKDTMETYKLAHVNKAIEKSKTADSITASLDIAEGTKGIKEYYFGIEEIGKVSTVSLIDGIEYHKSDKNEYTFTDLNDETNYKIYGYVVDAEGFSSNIYKGETSIVATEKAPVITTAKVTSKGTNEINIEVEATKGTNDIVGYEYSISGASIPTQLVVEKDVTTYKFSNLSAGQPYEINVRAKDSKGSYSLPYTLNKNTASIYNYDYTDTRLETGESYAFTTPSDGTYKIELWGASGGKGIYHYNVTYATQGLGGYTAGTITLTKGTPLYVYVGEQGAEGILDKENKNKASFNGGGSGTTGTDGDDGSGSGGGATDIRITNGEWNNFDSLKTRIMIAGGGSGGPISGLDTISAGSGGGLTGVGDSWAWPSIHSDSKFNATQTTGYKFGIGENGYASGTGGSGGGGGYYGGWADNYTDSNKRYYGGGGGGSSFISGHAGCLAIDESSLEEAITLKASCTEELKTVECATHYSNYKFENTEMIDGLGYKWTTEAGDQTGMPSPTGGNENGHDGNGYARITPISIADE